MSSDIGDRDVILIAPQSKNQDGSQTFYILDPCPSSENSDEPREIELIDLTAEVKNTGAIAVLSTNTNTGALEITLTNSENRIKEEVMDTEEDSTVAQLNDTCSIMNQNSTDEIIMDDDLADCGVKDEDEDVDVEEISFTDVHADENDSVELRNDSYMDDDQQVQNEQDDEEEGTLYIDDAKCSDFQDEFTQDNPENPNNFNEIILEEEPKTEQFKTDYGNTETPKIEEDIPYNQDKSVQNCIVVNNESSLEEALVHGHLIQIPTYSESEKSDDKEYVDSTNTALTLLELAGGTSYRNNSDRIASEMGDIEQNLIQSTTQFVSSEDIQLQTELTTLTTLQPVPVEAPVTPASVEVVAVENSELVETKPQVPSTPRFPSNAKVSNELVQRLIEGDTPMLGIRGPKSQYKHLSSPIVTQDEIAQEILERSIQKCPYSEPSGGDVIFAMKLAHRLATRIVSPEKTATDKSENDTSIKSQNSTPLLRKDPIPRTRDVIKSQPQKKDAISDTFELLKILEDDPDDIFDTDQPSLLVEQKPKIRPKSKPRASPLIKLHPELEKKLALKQLQDFGQDQRRRKNTIPDVLKKVPKLERETLKKEHEHNNNFNSKNGNDSLNAAKRRLIESSNKSSKRPRKEEVDSNTATVDPSQITETLTVEGQVLVGEQTKDGKSLKQYSNKRLSRSSETPPREVPIEILLNGVEEDDENKCRDIELSKKKIFKATNTKKRQEELKRKHFANVLQRNKPHKKRGRPPKKKPFLPTDDMINQEFLMNLNNEQKNKPKIDSNVINPEPSVSNEEISPKNDRPQKSKKLREIEQLLGDEGAINMLYSVEQKRTSGGEPKRGMLPSYRRKKKDLMLKTKLVKSAVLRLTTNPAQATGRVSLRGQATKDDESEENADDASLRKMSIDSHDSHHSLSSPPAEGFSFPAKIVPAEASRIIRRHSSSSNYSSRSNSPRRLSVEGERANVITHDLKTVEIGQGDAPLSDVNKTYKHSKSHHQSSGGSDVKKMSNGAEYKGLPEEKRKDVNSNQEFSQHAEKKKTAMKTSSVDKMKSKVHFKSDKDEIRVKAGPGRPKKKVSHDETKKRTELSTSLAAAVNEFTKESETVNKTVPTETPKKFASPSVPSPGVNTRTSISKVAVYRKSPLVSPGRPRAQKSSIVYKDITLKRYDHLVEIILAPVSTKLKNALNINVLRELISVLSGLGKDENCRVVLITSLGNVFCQGIDFFALIQTNSEKRMTVAHEMAVAVKDFIKALAMFSKPVVAGVQGPAVGLGTTMLPLFDLVFSSQQATFHTPYAKLGQVPEGAATLTLPTLLGSSVTSELLFACRKLTATEALDFGLVTRILQSDDFHAELIPIVAALASQSSQSMDATKALLRHNLLAGLETTLMSETHLLIQHWTGAECQANFNLYLQDEEQVLALQKQSI